jgi:PadR family transcriptional regulator, regulatory protein PadR
VSSPRITLTLLLVLRAFLAADGEERYGLQVTRSAGVPSGTLYPMLLRLESIGWLTSRVEEADPVNEGRPLRRYYRLTEDGARQARAAVDGAAARLVF